MENSKQEKEVYRGFEQGLIRPPSEAGSLLLRLTRNCPWNRCTFCRVYTRRKFSLRPREHIIRDIDLVHVYITGIQDYLDQGGELNTHDAVTSLFGTFPEKDRTAFNAALNWYIEGMTSIFLQDANSLIMRPADLIAILEHIRTCFPQAQRITSYARSHTIVRIRDEDLAQMARAGLNRIHVGMESGSDTVLERVNKGVTQAVHITAGCKIRNAGMELSEYVMPGLGGIELSVEHALETASALNRINPEFIRLRTLAVTDGTELAADCRNGRFEKPSDVMMAREIRLFLEALNGIESFVKSDHILNLFESIEGKLPEDKDQMIAVIDRFFELSPQEQVLYQVGRRMGVFRDPDDIFTSSHVPRVKQACDLYRITPETVDAVMENLMKRFV